MAGAAASDHQQHKLEQRQNHSTTSSRSHTTGWLSADRVFQLLLAYRLVNALTIRTFFQPDEYYQALEPAWKVAFGTDGHAWITWEWYEHLRSSLHPALFSLAYRTAALVADYSNLTPHMRADLLLAAPKVLQAVIAATGDFFTWRLAQKIYGTASKPAFAALILTCLNPWQWFCSTRTFSNGVEATLTTAALYRWPFSLDGVSTPQRTPSTKEPPSSRTDHEPATREEPSSSPGAALLLAAFATLLRPTNIIIWTTLAIYALLSAQTSTSKQESHRPTNSASSRNASNTSPDTRPASAISIDILVFLQYAVSRGLLALLISVALDYFFFGQLTFPPLNFLVFNVIKSLSVFYGNNDWHYYLSQGYPLLLTTALPFTIVGMYQVLTASTNFQSQSHPTKIALRGLVWISVTLPAFLSVLAHKEVRFIYPLLPTFHILASSPVWQYFEPVLLGGNSNAAVSISTKIAKRTTLSILLAINAIIAIYTSQIHNSGLVSLPDYLRKEYEAHYLIEGQEKRSSAHRSMTVAFLMPCHSVPWRSHLQYPPTAQQPGIKAWALTCEPPLHIDDPALKAKYRDEADLFYDDPSLWIRQNMARSTPEGNIDNRGTKARREAGVYADSSIKNKKKLWGQRSRLEDRGIDILDLLPYLNTWNSSSLSLSPSSSSKPGETTHEASAIKSSQPNRLKKASLKGESPSSAHQIRRPWPHYLAFFEQLEHTMHSALRGSGYRQCWRTFNSQWHDDWRRTGDIIVWCLRPTEQSRDRHALDPSNANTENNANKGNKISPSRNDGSGKSRDNRNGRAGNDPLGKQRGQRGGIVDQRPSDASRGRDRVSSGQRAMDMLNAQRG